MLGACNCMGAVEIEGSIHWSLGGVWGKVGLSLVLA